MKSNKVILDEQEIRNNIHLVRGLQVMIDEDLAELYEVQTKVLNQAVKRNIERFPENFMFQMSQEEFDNLRSQFVTSNDKSLKSQIATIENKSNLRFKIGTPKSNHGERRYLPYAFTEQEVAMAMMEARNE